MRAQSLERALPAIAGFIADRTGIQIIRGNRASTNNVAITLPRRRSEIDLTERDLVETVAYLYHEAGHMLHSNFTLAATTPLQRAITGILEDIRIEHLVMGKFPAARRYLTRLVGLMVEESEEGRIGFRALDGSEPESAILQGYMLYRLRHEVLRQDPLAAHSAGAIKVAQDRLPAGMLTRLDALMFQITSCATEDEVFQLADVIIEMIKEEKEKEQEQKRQQQQAQQEQEDSGQQDGEDDAQQQGQSSGDSAAGEEEEQGGQQQGQPENSSESDEDGQGNSQSGNSQEAEGEASPETVAGSGGAGAGGDMEEALEQLLGMSDQDVQEDLGEMLQNALNAAATAEDVYGGVRLSVPNVHKARLAAGKVDMATLRASVNATRTRTLQWMSSVADGDVAHSRSGMKIDSSRIWQGRLGGSIFVREDEGIDINAAVSIVIDRSGSMSGIIGHAAQAAVATMLAFDVPGMKTQVSVFPWLNGGEEGVAIIKHWNESPSQLASRAASLTTDGGTPMAEAILFAASDVVRREETLKIVLVVTDGDPNDRAATKYIIDRARADGITVGGLGIGIDPSPVFESRYAASINNIGELSASMVRLVKAAFEDNRRTH